MHDFSELSHTFVSRPIFKQMRCRMLPYFVCHLYVCRIFLLDSHFNRACTS
uniref:Uncharacterized protein n=1 Tax=Arundo donax TaxID=35708 RepID=A0A0A9BD14_ARUDO